MTPRTFKRRRLSTAPTSSVASATAAAIVDASAVKEGVPNPIAAIDVKLAALDELDDDMLLLVAQASSQADRVVLGFLCPRAAALMASEAAATTALDLRQSLETQVRATYADGSIEQIAELHERVNATALFPAAQWLGLLGGRNGEKAGMGDALLVQRLLAPIGVDKSAYGREFVANVIRDATLKGMEWFMRDLANRAWAGAWLHDTLASRELVERGHEGPFVSVVLRACNITCIVAFDLLFGAIAQRKWPLAQAIFDYRNVSGRGHYHCLMASSPTIRSRIIRSLIEQDCDEAMEFMLSKDGCAVPLDASLLLHTTDAPRANAYLKRRLDAAAAPER